MDGAKSMPRCEPDDVEPGPYRLCAVSRVQKPIDELLRFVLGPDGAIVPDLTRRLPGRGTWVTATRDAIAAAVRQKVFARSLKTAVRVPAELPDLVDRLMVRRLSEAVSIANKAGLLVAGFTKVETLIERRRAVVLLHAADAAADGAAKLDSRFRALLGSEPASAATISCLTSAELSLAIGRSNVIHAAASEGGASQRILQEAGRLTRFRKGEGPSGAP